MKINTWYVHDYRSNRFVQADSRQGKSLKALSDNGQWLPFHNIPAVYIDAPLRLCYVRSVCGTVTVKHVKFAKAIARAATYNADEYERLIDLYAVKTRLTVSDLSGLVIVDDTFNDGFLFEVVAMFSMLDAVQDGAESVMSKLEIGYTDPITHRILKVTYQE